MTDELVKKTRITGWAASAPPPGDPLVSALLYRLVGVNDDPVRIGDHHAGADVVEGNLDAQVFVGYAQRVGHIEDMATWMALKPGDKVMCMLHFSQVSQGRGTFAEFVAVDEK